jgi:alkanesulfonate monooxygenase SsuD/methylene tetrahydromethanopterin reductase-like flavin-dependent oxidoreductase (luciferase family)
MLRDERPTFSGEHYRVENAINQPPPINRIPIMIGGSGERKTLRMVAQYADEANFTCPLDEVPRKLDALAAHCERLGRDRSEIAVSKVAQCVIAPTVDEAYADARAFMLTRGVDLDAVDDDTRASMLSMVTWGGPDEVGEWFESVKAIGLDGVTCSLPANGQNPDRVELLGRTASSVFGV